MHLPLILLAAAALAGCTATNPATPQLGVGIGIGPGGIRLTPRLTTNVGGVTVGATPGGLAAGANVGGVNIGTGTGGTTASTTVGPVSVNAGL